ncbi:MAG: hypothetical protein E7628_07465 [Ruminococcaceae bacterium]|nr:hypothetical protein [Oscillospiraceae bacterium]
MMKKLLVITLALMLLLSGCNVAETPNTDQAPANEVTLDPDAVSSVISEWEKIVAITDAKGEIELWALGYIQEFCNEPTVPKLQCALAAASAALDDLRKIETAECGLTAETLAVLAEDGVDMSFVPMNFSNLQTELDTDIAVWERIVRSLLTDSFWKYGIEYLSDWSAVRKATVELNCLYIAKMSNAVMLSLGESEENVTFKSWLERGTTVFSGEYEWNPDNDMLADEISDVLDLKEENIVDSAAVTGVLSANYAMFSDAYATGDWSEVYSVAVDYEEYFMPVPLPDWETENGKMAVYSYRYDDATAKSELNVVGDDLTTVPDGFVMMYGGVTFEELSGYANLLDSLGFKYSEDSTITEDSVELKYYNYCWMTLQWKNDTVYFYLPETDTLLVPSWYILYMLQ